jgi:flagellar hook protein FlgE
MYQDAIGKGSKVLEAEKIYKQGNMKATGVSYDVALEGSGFFTVKDPAAIGNSEEFYTRAGNFRMGETGTLQDSNQFDVLGWGISSINIDSDIVTTNSNVTRFTNDYGKIAANQIIHKDTTIETITGKLTDYVKTSVSDATSVMSGLGLKKMSAKITDTEALMMDYQNKLADYAKDPSANSSPSVSQITKIELPGLNTSKLKTESDQIYVYIDGIKYSQNYIETSATQDLTDNDYDGDGSTSSGTLDTDDDVLTSRIATYKALADKISAVTGLKAYIADSNNDPIEGSFKQYADTVGQAPKLVVEALIPGKEFAVGDVAEYIASDSSLVPGTKTIVTESVSGTGFGAVKSARKALIAVSTGYQRDVWSPNELPTIGTDDKLKFTIANPDDTSNPFTIEIQEGETTITTDASDDTTETLDAALSNDNKIDSLVKAINSHSKMAKVLKAHNYNGNLVVETINLNPGGTFVSVLSYDAGGAGDYVSQNKSTSFSINSGSDAEFIEVKNILDQTASKNSLQLRLDNLGISDSAFGEFSVDETGLITMKQDGADYAVGQIAIAMFNNERGLQSEGNNLMSKTNDSGSAIYNINNDKTAKIANKALEFSTADLSESLVNLMVFQRAFEANSKSITTADQVLTTLLQLKK